MNKTLFPLPVLVICSLLGDPGFSQQTAGPPQEPVDYGEYFTPERLRVDFEMAGNASETTINLDQVKEELEWSGPRDKLIDPFNYGTYRITLTDSASGRLIFSRGFSNLYQEWQGTPEAKLIRRSFPQVAIAPFPKKTILFQVEKRRYEDGLFEKLFGMYINPGDYFIHREKPVTIPFEKIKDSGDPVDKVDVAFLAEGYTIAEMPKFLQDAHRIMDYMLTVKPYSRFKNNFNFYAVESPSAESGVEIPGKHVYVNTNMNSSFYTFDMDRYLTTTDVRRVYDLAAMIPYDIIVILVNSNKYGGGGFFNHYCESTVDNPLSNIVAIHEFGHSFAGLADEYIGDVSYSDAYNPKVEPWEPNITTNVHFEIKWKNRIPYGTPVPTPRSDEYRETVGMFEGGGYMSQGMFSPYEDCRMKSNEAPGFCPVCEEAIKKMIRFYSE